MIRKGLGILICCVLVFGVVQAGVLPIASAATIVKSGSCGENVNYTLDNEGLLTIYGNGNMTYTKEFQDNESIKKVIIKNGVTALLVLAFAGCSKLTNITIPKSVTSIGNHAFSSCSGLTSITIPEGVTSIGKYAFYNCSGLTSIIIPKGVKSIEECTFFNCSELINITIPKGVISIDKCAFLNCSKLKNITIPAGLTSIGVRAFAGCADLISIIIPESVTSIGISAFYRFTIIFGENSSYAKQYADENDMLFVEKTPCSLGHTWDKGTVTVKATKNSKGIKVYTCTICNEKKVEYIFSDDFLIASGKAEDSKWFLDREGTLTVSGKGHSLPDSFRVGDFNDPGDWYDIVDDVKALIVVGEYDVLKNAGFGLFKNLKTVEINMVKALKDPYFSGCSNLFSVKTGPGVYYINSFRSCYGLQNVELNKDIRKLGDYAFSFCNALKSVRFVSGDVFISDWAFSNCGNVEITVPAGKTVVCENAFAVSSANVHFLGNLPEFRGELDSSGNNKVICYYPCNNDTWKTRLPKTVEWREEHAYGEWKRISDLQHQRVCANDASHKETGEHVWDNGVYKAATCTVAGGTTYTCSVCNGTKTEKVSATGHSYGGWIKLNDSQHKRICKYNSSHMEKADHIWNAGSVTTYATCKSTGIKTYTCTVCGGTKKETIAIDTENHAGGTEIKNAVAVTCAVDGYTGDIYCKDCGAKLSDGSVIAKTEKHNWNSGVITTVATCVSAGVKTFTCSVCDETMTESIPATGHAYGEWMKLNDDQHQRICKHDATHKETEGHSWDEGVVKAASCTTDGVITYTCSVCGATKTEPIPAKGHAYGECTKLNDTQHQRVCANDAAHTEIADHEWTAGIITVEPTYETTGIKTFTCTVCGMTRDETIEKLKPQVMPGDVNGDRDILANDARLALRASAKLEPLDETQFLAADVDGDGKVLAGDARQILRYSAKLQNKFVKAA